MDLETEGRLQQGGLARVRLRLGDGAGRSGGQARAGLAAEPGFASDGRQETAVRQRRLGARLLPEISESPPRISRGLVERAELAADRPAIRRGEVRDADDLKPLAPGEAHSPVRRQPRASVPEPGAHGREGDKRDYFRIL